jgi:hypothetical protein
MNCVRCGYLLWNLPSNRCPECGLGFEATDYCFAPGSVAFVCRDCGQACDGGDGQGFPAQRRWTCSGCGHELNAAEVLVRPLRDDAHGDPVHLGTPWEHRHRIGFVRAFLDGVARLAMQPAEYFRLSSACHGNGEMVFSVLCAYVACGLVVGILLLLQGGGLLGWLPDLRALLGWRALLLVGALVPIGQIVWNYVYGLLILAVLLVLGRPRSDYESSVRAVAFGSAVLPAVLLFAPVGLLWYINVVSSGVEHLQGTSRAQALVATLIPILLAGNLALAVTYAVS